MAGQHELIRERTVNTVSRLRVQTRYARVTRLLRALHETADDRARHGERIPVALRDAIRRLDAERTRIEQQLDEL